MTDVNSTPLAVLPVTAHFERHTRIMPMIGDSMAPTIRAGDFAIIVPCDRFTGEGLYVVIPAVGMNPAIYRISFTDKQGFWRLRLDNRAYSAGHDVPQDEVNKLIVGAVAGILRIERRDLLAGVC